MAELKTKLTEASVADFLKRIPDPRKRADAQVILKLMGQITKAKPKMWGSSIVGFGTYRYKYASGREGDWLILGFSPRKQALTLYIHPDAKRHAVLLKKLGKHKTGMGCLYINKLKDVDMPTLRQLVQTCYRDKLKFIKQELQG